ncbi:hypothetical protein Cgig2_010481 [Carnegiea gigantea]|uniref:Uncharacterized protein n=1 Tax=Carnegiea gigantea TaxID=171969 RepID=A0A9Q1KRX4_9CARY|nr:hypothetical protein Cgig2_010481 [Carnegiea gigantea]
MDSQEESSGSTGPLPPSSEEEYSQGPLAKSGLASCRLGKSRPLRETPVQCLNPLPTDHHSLYPGFNLSVATQYAHDPNIPEMVQAMFYAMVVNDVVEQGLTCRLTVKCMIWVMYQLNWAPIKRAHASRLANPSADLASSSGPVEHTGLSDAPPASSDEDGDVPQGLAGPQVAGYHPQFSSLPAFIDGWVVTDVTPKNQCRKPKMIPYAHSKAEAEVLCTHSSSFSAGASTSSSDEASADSSDDESSSRSSSSEASANSSMQVEPSALGRVVLRKRGCTLTEPVHEVVVEGFVCPRAPTRSDPQDGPSKGFSNLKVAPSPKRTALEKKYLLPTG